MIIIIGVLLSACGPSQTEYQRGYSAGQQSGEATGIQKGSTEGYERGYKEGYQKGETDGISKGFNEGREKGLQEGYIRGYNAASGIDTNSESNIDEVIFSSKGTLIMFWVFSILNMIVLAGVSMYLTYRDKVLIVQIGKGLVYVVSSYLWFRFMQSLLPTHRILSVNFSETTRLIIEVSVLVLSFLLCLIFDKLYIKKKVDSIWLDCIGIAFCTILFLQILHYLLNNEILLSIGDPSFPLHLVGAFSIGGILYTIYWILRDYAEKVMRRS
jgi:hypothetical protein